MGLNVLIVEGNNPKDSEVFIRAAKASCSENLKNIVLKLEPTSNVTIINDRVENIKNHSFDYIISRATAKINEIFSMSYHLKKNSTVYLLHKGVHVVDEINSTTKYWKFDYNIHENKLEKGSNIFEAKNIIKSIT